MTGALPPHVRQYGAGDGEQAEYVGGVDPLHFQRRSLFDSTEQTETGIVDQDIDSAEALDRSFGRRNSLLFVGDVERHGQEVRPLTECLGDGLGRACRGDDIVAALQSLSGDDGA